MKKKIEILNKKATFSYHVEQRYEAGLALLSTEVKSIRANNVNMGDAYCFFFEGEIFLKNMHISEAKNNPYQNHEPMRERKLLLRKQEIKKIESKIKQKNYAMFPIRLFENERGILKLELGLGQGKKLFDKRDDIKEKDVKRDLERSAY